jgi:hypothetical protein
MDPNVIAKPIAPSVLISLFMLKLLAQVENCWDEASASPQPDFHPAACRPYAPSTGGEDTSPHREEHPKGLGRRQRPQANAS